MPAATPDKPGKIYVGNLPPAIEKSQLQETFSKYGDIDNVLMVVDRETGASKGFAFVTYSNPKDANDAVTAMNEKDFMGKVLKVDHALMAITRQLRGGRGGGDRGGRGRGGPRGLLGGPPRGGFRGGPRGGGGRGGFPPRGGFRGHPRGRGGPPGRFNGPQGPHMMGGGDDYGEEMGMRRGGHRGRGRGEPLLQQPPSLMSEDYHSARQEREEYRAPMEERGGRAPPSRDDYGMSSYGTAQSTDPYYAGREAPSDYGAASGASREYPETYGREDPYAAGRDRYGASRDPLAREPLSREPQAREPATREPLSREPRGYERDSYSRDYSAAATTRDAYAAPARDPYSAPATTERSSYEYPAAREDPYASRSAAADPRAAYEEPRREVAREYEQRPAADRGYGKEYSAYGAEPARTEDPYSRAAPERDYGGSASASRYEGYGSRDPYTRTERTDKAPYGSRDPYGSAGGPPEARTGGAGGRGYERHY